jgi:hypothetical protein
MPGIDIPAMGEAESDFTACALSPAFVFASAQPSNAHATSVAAIR